MKGTRLGKLWLGSAHRWRDTGRSLLSLCGLGRLRSNVDFKADFMWPVCARCEKAAKLQRDVLAKRESAQDNGSGVKP